MSALFDRVAAQHDRVERAKTTAAREQDKLDALVAEAVSTQPASPVWFEHSGLMTRQEVRSAASLTELGLLRTMERYRRAAAAKPRRRKG